MWHQIKGVEYISNVTLETWRIVEDQSKSTTRKYVDSAIEHDLLESLIEKSKPKIKYYGDEQYFKDLHYLLHTPFRYPPLRWGSRFCTKLERALLYSSTQLTTAMSEKAFYKLAFFRASSGNLGGKTLSFTSFSIHVHSDKYINLCDKPFKEFEEKISSKLSYTFSQELGKQMRNDKVECFKYTSARSPHGGQNVAIFSPKVLSKNEHLEESFEHLNCYATKEVVEFSFKRREQSNYVFPAQMFMVNGEMPLPSV